MKAIVLDIDGKEKGKIELPKAFSSEVRIDIIQKVLETKKTKQPYSNSPRAGLGYSARGKIRHRRHVWKTQYGRGMSRVPRKVMSRRGAQFNWEAAGIPGVKGGMRAHPPKIISMVNYSKINKKEMRIALNSALSATINKECISKKYKSLNEKDVKAPLITENKITTLKAKELLSSLKKILGDNLFKIAVKKKSVRAGKGKARGRKYKSNAGLLIVTGEKEKIKTTAFDVVNAKNLGVTDLAKGGPGRLTLYTENAIKYIGERLK